MKSKASIYGNSNPQLTKLFETAGHSAKVMCVALDYAKEKHTALICDGRGQLLQKSFPVENSSEGAQALLEQVRRRAKKHKIAPEHVFFGGEDCPSYAENFVRRLRQQNRLVPGFLDRTKSGISPFGQASLELMAERFSPEQLRRRSRKTLLQWLGQRGLEQPQAAADQLKALVQAALEPAPEQAAMLQQSLAQLIKLYRGTSTSIGLMDKEVAYWLARTPGAFLTSIDGIGVTLAAVWTAELGPVSQWRAVRCLCSYSGVAPRSKQTGGPDKAPVVGSRQRRCNTRLKNAVLQAVQKVRQYGPEDLRQSARRLEEQGSHVEFGLAKRLLRLGKYLVLNGTVYRPKALLEPDTPKGPP